MKQHTTTILSRHHSASFPSRFVGRAAAPSNHGAASPQRHAQALSHQTCVRCRRFARLGGQNESGRKIEQRGGMTGPLSGRHFSNYTQKSIKSWRGRWRGSRGGRVAGAERAGETPCHRLSRRISIEKKSEREGCGHGHRWPQLNRWTQQPAKISVGHGRDMEKARNCRGTY